jgi:hypothetical protein
MVENCGIPQKKSITENCRKNAEIAEIAGKIADRNSPWDTAY